MRVVLLLTAAIVCAQAECSTDALVCELKEIGSIIKETTVNLGGQLATVGKAIFGNLVSKGSELLLQGSKAIVGTLNSHLVGDGQREVRLSQQVLDIIKQGETFMKTVGDDLEGRFQTAISKLIDLSNKVVSLDFTDMLTDDIDATVALFENQAVSTFSLIKTGVENFLRRVLSHELTTSKRGVSDLALPAVSTFQGALKSFADALNPQIQNVIGQIAILRQQVKNQVAIASDKLNQTRPKYSSKVSDPLSIIVEQGPIVVQQGEDAWDDVKTAVSQIAAQALINVKEALSGFLSKDSADAIAGQVIVGRF